MTTRTPASYKQTSQIEGNTLRNGSGRGKVASSTLFLTLIIFLPGNASPMRPVIEAHPDAVLTTSDGEIGQGTEDKRLTVADLEDMLGSLKARVADEVEIVGLIRERGVRFFADQAMIDGLRVKGATDAILKLINEIAPVRPKPTGSIALRCAPAECQIKLNNQPDVSTVDGRYVKAGLPLVEVIVNFKKIGRA